MEKLHDLRLKIDEIDRRMASLFEERLSVAKEIALLKKQLQIQVTDECRERELFLKEKSYLKDKRYCKYYEKLLRELIKISKEYQKDITESL